MPSAMRFPISNWFFTKSPRSWRREQATQHLSDSALKEQEAHIQHLLEQAGSKFGELRTIVETLMDIVKTTKIPIFRARAWRKNQPRLQALQEDIKTVKCSLNISPECL